VDVEAELAERLLVLRLAEDGYVVREELLTTRVEVIAVAVRDDHGVESAHDLLGRKRQRHSWVPHLRDCALDRRARAGLVQHRIDDDALSPEVENERRVAYERQLHGRVSTSRNPINA
jgi:hypothetical protein